jgi:hypothetical protein
MNRKLIYILLTLVWTALISTLSPVGAADSDPPRLAITYSPTNLLIEWPLAASDWILEQSASLGPDSPWNYVPVTLARTNGTNISLSVSPLGHSMFYRLSSLGSFNTAIPGLTASWKFDEGPSEIAQDASGHENGAMLANVGLGSGRIGPGSLWFNGGPVGPAASRAAVSNDSYRVLPSAGPFSISLWLNADALSTGWRGLIGNSANGSNGWHLALHNVGPGTNEFVFMSAGPGALNVVGRKLLLPGQWYELTATYDGSEGRIYVDSQLLAHGTGSLLANDQPIYFGGGVNNYDSFLGLIDEVRIFTNALSHEEVSLSGNWQMNENSGMFLADASVRGHRGILSSSGAWRSGKNGSGIDLSNSTVIIRNDYAEVLPPTGGSFSLSFWVYPEALSANWHGLISCANGTNNGWHLAIQGAGAESTRLRFWSTDSGGTLDLLAPIGLASGLWSKIDITFNGGIATLYLNGLKVQSSNGGIQGSKVPIIIGSVPGLPNFNGAIDQLKLYRRERDETEIGPVAKVMWETVLLNSSTNLLLQGFGPTGKPLTYAIVGPVSPTNGTITHVPGSPIVTYTAGATKGPDAFTYTVSDGEFTSPSTIVVMSVVAPHWLSPNGGPVPPRDGSSPQHSWVAGPADALDAIWKTNNYYDCFFYAPGEYQTTGSKWQQRKTANPGCKHVGSGSEGPGQTTLKLVNLWNSWREEAFFADWRVGEYCDGFEVRNLRLDCNAMNNPKYTIGEPVPITIPLISPAQVESVRLRWDNSYFNGTWRFGPAQRYSVATRVPGTSEYVTNQTGIISTGSLDTVSLQVYTDEILVRLERRAPSVDFYSLAEIEVNGGSVSLPSAEGPGGGESKLNPSSTDFDILHLTDGSDSSVWASGEDENVRILIPLESQTSVTHVILFWNCQTITNLGRLGPASEYEFQARNSGTGQYADITFTAQNRSSNGWQVITFDTGVITDELVILLNAKELGVNFYSLREVRLWNGANVSPKIPNALNSLSWGNYSILRAFDTNPSTQWASDSQGMIGAIDAVGSNLKFIDLRIVGFGTKATRECFPMFLHTPPAWAPSVNIGNILVQNCVFTDPATNNTDGLTAVWMARTPPHNLTNASIRNCTVAGVKSAFRYSHAFSTVNVEDSIVSNCQVAVYFEPNPAWGSDNVGRVLVRSNQFQQVDYGVWLSFAPAAQFDSLTCIGNEMVLTGAGGWGFAACDTCSSGPSGSTTNVTVLNNIIRYGDWSLRPLNYDGGIYCSDIHNSVFGNNLIVLGTENTLRLRNCPSGFIPPPLPFESCDSTGPPITPSGPQYPPCLDTLPAGYQRAWFNNHDLFGSRLKIGYRTISSDGFASQQQWPR